MAAGFGETKTVLIKNENKYELIKKKKKILNLNMMKIQK